MKKGLILLLIMGVIVVSFSYRIFASNSHGANAEGFHDYLIPVKMDTVFFEKKVTIFLTTKDNLPKKIDDKAGWMVGIDIDSNQETGGKWPKIGADYILSVIHRDGKWAASIKNVKTGVNKNINSEIMVAKNKVDFSIPLSELEMKTAFNWQIAVVTGDSKKALPDLIKATKEGQKENKDYEDTMKNM